MSGDGTDARPELTPAPAPPRERTPATDRRRRSHAALTLRLILGFVVVWLGVQKMFGDATLGDLASGVAWLNNDGFIAGLGAFQIVMGVVVMVGYRVVWSVTIMIVYLAGDFLLFVALPQTSDVAHGSLPVAMEGGLVIRNLVLIAAGLVVAGNAQPPHK
jgi:hypothetical protein